MRAYVPMYIMTVSRSVLLRIRNVSESLCRKNQNEPFVFQQRCSGKIVSFYEKMWKNMAE